MKTTCLICGGTNVEDAATHAATTGHAPLATPPAEPNGWRAWPDERIEEMLTEIDTSTSLYDAMTTELEDRARERELLAATKERQ